MGLNCPPTVRLTHLAWADNIWVFASSKEQLTCMLATLTEVVHSFYFEWKSSSLEFLQTGSDFVPTCEDQIVVASAAGPQTFVRVLSMGVLGTFIREDSESMAQLECALARGTKAFWGYSKYLLCR